MVAGHTKFTPDRLFAAVGSAYRVADIFTIHELQALCSASAETFIENGEDILTYMER